MTGLQFGDLKVIAFDQMKKENAYWRCLCACGRETTVRGTSLRTGTTKSCGCGSRRAALNNLEKRAREAQSRGVIRRQWKDLYRNMRNRCENPSDKRFENYGGRGIKVCDEWKNSRRKFYDWVRSAGWQPGLSIDRIDVDGDYCPENCRFVDMFVQQNNTTRNRWLTWEGRTQTVAQWARELNVRPHALQHRVDRNWTIDRIFLQPFRRGRGAFQK